MLLRLLARAGLGAALATGAQTATASVVLLDGTPDPGEPALRYWYRADADAFTDTGSTAATTAGDRIRQWRNQAAGAPSGSHASQSNSTLRPTFQPSALNGLPVVRFDGVDDQMSASRTVTGEKTFFLVATLLSDSGPCCEGGLNTDTYNGIVSRGVYWGADYPGDVLPLENSPRDDVGIPSVVVAVYDQNDTRLYVNDPTPVNTNTSSWGIAAGGIDLGSRNPEIDRWTHMDFAEALIYDGALTTAEIDEVGRYLSAKWGIDAWEVDADGDGFGFLDDCDDQDASVNPGATEATCNGIDDDCDPATLDGPDADGDGADSCADCDDADPTRAPGLSEVCDGIDNDCDSVADDGLTFSDWYIDADADTYGAGALVTTACAAPASGGPYSTDDGDCDDSNPNTFPGAFEVCDGADNDCNGLDDDGLATQPYFEDSDGDGFGDDAVFVLSCGPVPGYVPDPGDCDVDDPTVSPAESEICDGVDNDCDGET